MEASLLKMARCVQFGFGSDAIVTHSQVTHMALGVFPGNTVRQQISTYTKNSSRILMLTKLYGYVS